jgi:hypothetical protein
MFQQISYGMIAEEKTGLKLYHFHAPKPDVNCPAVPHISVDLPLDVFD